MTSLRQSAILTAMTRTWTHITLLLLAVGILTSSGCTNSDPIIDDLARENPFKTNDSSPSTSTVDPDKPVRLVIACRSIQMTVPQWVDLGTLLDEPNTPMHLISPQARALWRANGLSITLGHVDRWSQLRTELVESGVAMGTERFDFLGASDQAILFPLSDTVSAESFFVLNPANGHLQGWRLDAGFWVLTFGCIPMDPLRDHSGVRGQLIPLHREERSRLQQSHLGNDAGQLGDTGDTFMGQLTLDVTVPDGYFICIFGQANAPAGSKRWLRDTAQRREVLIVIPTVQDTIRRSTRPNI